MRRLIVLAVIGILLAGIGTLSVLGGLLIPRRRRAAGKPADILMTGSFHSNNWIASHLGPLARAQSCGRLRVVSTFPIAPMDKLELVVPPATLRRLAGDTGARLLTFFWEGIRRRPDYVAGFHLLINGLLAQLLARITGARSMYFCVGGPAEVLGGGINSENRLFERLGTPSVSVERALLRAVRRFDLIITMGSRARTFFQEAGVRCAIHVVSGGIDASRYQPATEPPDADMIFVGRLVPIKRVDLLLECVRIVATSRPDVRLVVVGDGPLRHELEDQANRLGIQSNVHFAGQQSDMPAWLRRARLFMLTSDSEGLSLALMEAMLCGLPAIVSDVGDLGDLVQSGANGYLVPGRSAAPFAERVLQVLQDSGELSRLARNARDSALKHELGECSKLWDTVLSQDHDRCAE